MVDRNLYERVLLVDRNLQYDVEFHREVIDYINTVRDKELDFKRELENIDWLNSEAVGQNFEEEMVPYYDTISKLGKFYGLRENKEIHEALFELIKVVPKYLDLFWASEWSHAWTMSDYLRLRDSK